MEKKKELTKSENVSSNSWILSPTAQNDVMASVRQPDRVASAPTQGIQAHTTHKVRRFVLHQNDAHFTLLPWMGCKGSKRGTSLAAPYALAEGGATRRMRVKKEEPFTRSSSFSKVHHTRNEGKGAAFTLSEVLITLGIIGVVAAMTLPSLMQNYQHRAIITALKKDYAIVSNAYSQIIAEDDRPNDYDELGERLMKQLSGAKFCNQADCRPKAKYKLLNMTPSPNFFNLVSNIITLNNGGYVYMGASSGTPYYKECDYTILYGEPICGMIHIDVNGDKNPNRIGEDTFAFYIQKNKIVPAGYTGYWDYRTCRPNGTSDFGYGVGCTAYVFMKDNMDYLKCKTGTEKECMKG